MFKRILISFLSIMMLLASFTYPLKANEVVEDEVISNETSANKILGEVIDKRSEDSKTFLLSNHEFQKIIYPFQVHEVNDEGSYDEIDNRLEEISEINLYGLTEEGNDYQSKNDKFKFSKYAHKYNMVSLKNSDYKITWGVNDIQNKNNVRITSNNYQDEINKVLNKLS